MAQLEYGVTINGVPGTIITANNNNTTKSNIVINSLNNRDSKYELIYKVCSNSECNNFIAKPSGLTIEYSSRTIDPITGIVVSSGNKSIRVILTNETGTNYYIKLDINAGYAHNTLALKNLITSEYNEEDLIIKATILGEESDTFPTTNGYIADIECTTDGGSSNASGEATWNGTKWLVDINGTDSGRTICTVYFDIPYLKNKILGKNNKNVTTPLTTPGRQISTSGEALLAATEDDYGTSYYYRGAVENNYVEFANMCWRIVRVVGDGSIKLVLYNYHSSSCTTSGSTYAFARYSGSSYTTTFNTNINQNAYIGFMYGTPKGSSYESVHTNTTKSIILTNLEAWYNRDSKFIPYEEMLADTIWCNDKSIFSGIGYGDTRTEYASYGRLNEVASATPSLKCPNDANGGKLSKFTVNDTTKGNGALDKKIGLLTIDEQAFAGTITNTSNTTYYLYKNANYDYWTLSPFMMNRQSGDNFSMVWYLSDGRSPIWERVFEAHALRPAISLISTATISGGIGTSDKPYIIST